MIVVASGLAALAHEYFNQSRNAKEDANAAAGNG